MASLLSPYRILSPAGRAAKLDILIFHRVYPARDPLAPTEPDVARFDRLMGFLRRGFNVLPLGEAVTRLRDGTLPPAAACVTFDDGYADNLTLALPVLARHDIPATIFVAPGYLDGGRMWNDTIIESVRGASVAVIDLTDLGLPRVAAGSLDEKRTAIATLLPLLKYRPLDERTRLAEVIGARARATLPRDLMLTTDQLRALAADPRITIGAHTRLHPILASSMNEPAETEIRGSRQDLESTLQRPVDLFAYPNGRPDQDYRAAHVAMVRAAGFRAAVSTAQGVATASSDPFQLPRFTPWGQSMLKFSLQLARVLAGRPSPVALAEAA